MANMLRRSASSCGRDLIFRLVSRSDRKWRSEPCGRPGLSRGDVLDDAINDERQKVESMFSKLWIRVRFYHFHRGRNCRLLAYGFTRDSRYIQSPLIAKQALSFTTNALQWRDANVEGSPREGCGFLTFGVLWCVPCRAEARTT